MVSARTRERRRRTAAVVGSLATFGAIMFSCQAEESLPHSVSVPNVPAEFIDYAKTPAQEGFTEYGVPASVSMAQAILESNWGRSELSSRGYAFFGIKCGSSPHVAGCTDLTTSECDDSGCHDVVASFRIYASPEDSFNDHGYFLTTNQRYADAFDYTGDPKQFAVEVAEAGYATDPAYAAKLIELMDTYNLYQYDVAAN